MLSTTAIKGMLSFGGESLLTSINRLATELAEMKQRLQRANDEIARLSGQLDSNRRLRQLVSSGEISTLRRRVAFHCHPDRGGDTELMSRLNGLFDTLQQVEAM